MRFEQSKEDPTVTNIILETEEEKEKLAEYQKLFCDCEIDHTEEENAPRYEEGHLGVDHGWVCEECDKFVQIG